MHNCIYEGWVRHRRYQPVENSFNYKMFMMHLDLAELETVFAGRWLWSTSRFALARFRRDDHLSDASISLDEEVRALVEQHTGNRPTGPITLLTHLRYFGYVMNPVSFYYCWDSNREKVESIVAEVNNTPWGERHCYVLGAKDNLANEPRKRFKFQKDFHVSPFMDMNQMYDWRFTDPNKRLHVHMENYESKELLFDATMALQRKPITSFNLMRVLIAYPFMTLKVISAIHYQALRLYLKRCPFYPHPRRKQAVEEIS